MANEKKIVARVDESLHRKVKIKAVRKGKSITEVVKEQLERWTSDPDDDPPEED